MVTGETRLPEEILSQPGRFVHPSPRWRHLSQLQHLSETIYIFPQEPPTKEAALSFHLSGLSSCSHSSILPELMCFPWIWNQRKRRVGFSSTLLQRGRGWRRELPRRLRQKKIFFLSLSGIGFHWNPTVFSRLHDFNPRFPKSRGGLSDSSIWQRAPRKAFGEESPARTNCLYLSQAHQLD